MALDERLDAAAAQAEISGYDEAMRDFIESSVPLVAQYDSLVAEVADSVVEITLPELPSWMRWRLTKFSMKLTDNGSAGNNTLAIAKEEAPGTDLATITQAHDATNNTWSDASNLDTHVLYAGLSRFVLNVNAVATAANTIFARLYAEAVAVASLRGDNWELPA